MLLCLQGSNKVDSKLEGCFSWCSLFWYTDSSIECLIMLKFISAILLSTIKSILVLEITLCNKLQSLSFRSNLSGNWSDEKVVE